MGAKEYNQDTGSQNSATVLSYYGTWDTTCGSDLVLRCTPEQEPRGVERAEQPEFRLPTRAERAEQPPKNDRPGAEHGARSALAIPLRSSSNSIGFNRINVDDA